MNEQKKIDLETTDEIGGELENGDEVNTTIEQQGEDAAAGIPRGTDAAKHEHDQAEDDQGLTGAP